MQSTAGRTAELPCPLYVAQGMQVRWSKLHDELPPGADVYDRTLRSVLWTIKEYMIIIHYFCRIPDFQPQYAGVYKCEAEIAQTAAVGYIDLAAEGASLMIRPSWNTSALATATVVADITDPTTASPSVISRGGSKHERFTNKLKPGCSLVLCKRFEGLNRMRLGHCGLVLGFFYGMTLDW